MYIADRFSLSNLSHNPQCNSYNISTMNNSPINSTTVGELADATSLRVRIMNESFG